MVYLTYPEVDPTHPIFPGKAFSLSLSRLIPNIVSRCKSLLRPSLARPSLSRVEVAPSLITYRRKASHMSGLETIREEINEGSDDDT
ncbi:hypothetical protein K7X08_037651 [Anisodus acutangulus]|uniref:Uncharacterized protein n=1 Tax=Anisodus acutangulus TaxID=402998 RepID=A0A9Q1MWV5_9SOLA|nr:hypothetical protein K7X08_037651 [Anisodus acutangulus]